ncbi:hypothetical protein [Aquimarina sp. 2201CG14-23]|uniref:hypothetical protein n=1 Tax=Aquimarina mycalae TaxID=3040073 RepID=UPI002477CEB0|nr:hypothetical protein [Aquimarina sp. 2201CG14-23]MDH7445060.1 hypothetical protein [Aquimarina sp. 2201CG14-23]
MKKLPIIALFIILSANLFAQIGPNDANALMGLPTATDLTEINAILNPQVGSVVFNLADEEIYRYTGITNGWQLSTDDQNSSEVPLASNIDVNEGAIGSPTLETTVEEVIQAIAPITSKAARVFYPPSIEIDASVNGTFSVDLYAMYTAQFGIPTAVSTGAPATVPLYAATDLYYYVTFADSSVFDTAPGAMTITAAGVLTYTVIGQPADFNTLINVVFVVR